MADLSYSVNFLNVTFGDDDLTSDSAIRDQPLMEILGDPEVRGGSTVEEKFKLSGPRGFSGNLADAQMIAAGRGRSKHFRWQHPFGEHIGSVEVDIPDIIQGRPDQAAADQALEEEMDAGLAAEGQNLSDKLMGRAGLAGGLGEWEENAGTPTGFPSFCLRFADQSDARNYQVGDYVVISDTDGTTDGDLVGEIGVVCGRDIALGYIRIAHMDDDEVPANPGGWVDETTYFVYRLGEYTDGDPDSIITSFERFLPAAAASDTMHNVDRSVDSILSGCRNSDDQDTGSNIQRAKRLMNLMYSRAGAKTRMAAKDYIHVSNPEDWGLGVEDLQSQGVRDAGSETTVEGYASYTVHTVAGPLSFVAEPGKNKGRSFLLNKKLLKVYSASGKWFETVPDGGGNVIHLKEGRMTYEMRTISKVATGFGAPYMHGTHANEVG